MAKNTDMSSWFFNENFNGVPDDFFDGQSLANDAALDLFDFSSVPVEENSEVEDWEVKFESIELPPPDALATLSSAFCSQGFSEANKKSQVSLKRAPKVLDSRRSLHQIQSNSSSSKGSCVIQTSSPTSVLDSSNSSSSSTHPAPFSPKIVIPVKRRSKRPRSPSSKQWSNSELLQQTSKRKEKRKILPNDPNRKCAHCQAMETPQWREGPQGPKTLCNACGVRYRSGRLFPEYRPAASPTFAPSLHSNSHRKVAELRKKASLEVVPQQANKTCVGTS